MLATEMIATSRSDTAAAGLLYFTANVPDVSGIYSDLLNVSS